MKRHTSEKPVSCFLFDKKFTPKRQLEEACQENPQQQRHQLAPVAKQ